ncbi:MAG: protein kinase family protein, partial [Isosphaeraceae bacterium]
QPSPPPADGPFRRVLERSAYPEAIAWVVACLADALSYAHERGMVHMDIKPSNVLITVDGQPMLLDFHLARGPIAPGDRVTDRLGGTPGWMSPEQQEAMSAVRAGKPVSVAVDGRSDIYALGLLLHEGLSIPPLDGGGRQVARERRDRLNALSVGLTDIMRKCLAVDPAQRYPTASALADDLRRHINDQPLRGVRNRSLSERWGKWRRRHPGALAWGVTTLAILAAAAAGLTAFATYREQQVSEVRATLEGAHALANTGRFQEAIKILEHGLHSSGRIVDAEGLSAKLLDELRRVRRQRTEWQLRELADQVRYRYGIDLPSADDARVLMQHCRVVWDQHGRLKPAPGSTVDPDQEARIRTDLIEIVVVWTDTLVKLATPETAASARAEALGLLDEADRAFGPSLALDDRRASLRAADSGKAPEPRLPRSIWEFYDRGRFRLRRNQLEAAAADFRQVLATKPDDFWSNFYDGLCAFRLRAYHDAVASFRTCLAILPDSAVCYYNRSLALAALGRTEEAYRDVTNAIRLDPNLAVARLNRGVLAYEMRRYADAVVDLEHALGLPAVDRETQARVHYNLALARHALGDVAGTRREAEAAVALGSVEAQPLLDARGGGRPAAPR